MHKQTSNIEQVLEKVGQLKFNELNPEEELLFYREILSTMKANIYINQIDDINDFTSAKSIWVNADCLKTVGYTLEEVHKMGYKVFTDVTHKEDVEISQQSIDFYLLKQGDCYGGVTRFFTKNKEYIWHLGKSIVLRSKKGKPWQFLNVSINIQDEFQTQKQVLALQRENLQIKNKLLLTSLTKREKEILFLIASGKTDREIATGLSISDYTVHTHRKNIHKKLGKTKTAELAVFASECGGV